MVFVNLLIKDDYDKLKLLRNIFKDKLIYYWTK